MSKITNKKYYYSPVISVENIFLEECMVSGSATINTGWNQAGSENSPKETEWETGWNTGNSNFDL